MHALTNVLFQALKKYGISTKVTSRILAETILRDELDLKEFLTFETLLQINLSNSEEVKNNSYHIPLIIRLYWQDNNGRQIRREVGRESGRERGRGKGGEC